MATAITDDYSRAEALTGLAPHLLPGLLAQALASTPRGQTPAITILNGSTPAITAVLERARSVLTSAEDEQLLGCFGPA